ITQVIMAGVRTVKAMASNVVELNTAMTELRKVTDETDASYEKFLGRATTRSKELGAALSDTVTATADFARLGYGIKDAEKLADTAIIYKNVGDGIEDINDASESIIATMQAFGVLPEEAMTIVDKFNEVGNKYAISSKGVGDALLRSSAAMKAAGNTIDETIALAAAANTVVQDPDKVGTTLKTVSMFLRAAKTEAEEAGESTDGMASSVSKLRDEILALTGNKVDIQIDDDTFKSTYQILKELSALWN
ncbi:MAG: phage tail tape measure protein, partial [Alphaproteobacteria bacterium]|nr:phage tail tape measure protein [Alphaproteobacteria bacterium]